MAQFYPLLEQKLSEKYIYRLGLSQPEKINPEFSELLLKAAAATQMPFARLFAELYGGEVDFDTADPRWQTHQHLLDFAASMPRNEAPPNRNRYKGGQKSCPDINGYRAGRGNLGPHR